MKDKLSMSKQVRSIDKRLLYNSCLQYLDAYVSDMVAIQEEVFVSLKDEFTRENVCEPTSTPKYMAAVSSFSSVSAARGDIYMNLNKCYMLWKDKLEPDVRNSTKKHTYAELPTRLAACFLLNGDYYKALLCLLHSINLESRNLLPRALVLKWSAFLGEWEMAEMALAFEKGKPIQKDTKEDYFAGHLILMKELVKCYVEFNRDHKSRTTSGTSLLKMTNKVNCDTRTTFLTFEAQSFANWMCSHIPKVTTGTSLDNVEILDPFNCLHLALAKSDGVVKNRIPGIHKESEPVDFRRLSSDVNDFLKACSSYAEFCDLRREYSIELVNVGLVHDAAFQSQLGLWGALKIGIFFRIQQFVNVNTLIRQCVVQVEFRNDLQFCINIIRMLCVKKSSSKNSLYCSKYKDVVPDETPFDSELILSFRKTPTSRLLPASMGHKSVAASIMESFEDLRLERTTTVLRSGASTSKLVDSFNELKLNDDSSALHQLSERCICEVCGFCRTNYNAYFEYWLSSFLYDSMSNASIRNLLQQFHKLRPIAAEEQCLILGRRLKPRPPSTMCETFAMCVVRWLRRLEEVGWDRENKDLKSLRGKVVGDAFKICSYSSIRTLPYRLAISQLERMQHLRQRSCYNWMVDNSHSNNLMDTVARYLFPNRASGTVDSVGDDHSLDSNGNKELKKTITDEALSEYNLHSGLLYRDWRFSLCTFLGEYASCPWLAAMMWSESTLLATRQLARHISGRMKSIAFSQPNLFQKMIVNLPADFTLVHLAMSHDGSLHLIKMHQDREPIIMPLAPKSKVENVKAMMDKIIDENTRTCNMGRDTKDAKEFWAARRAVDNDLKNFIPRVQEMLLGAAAPLLLPSFYISGKGIALAESLVSASQSPSGARLPLSFAKELVSLATQIEKADWVGVFERMCDILGIFLGRQCIQKLYSKIKTSMGNVGFSANIFPSYVFLIICPDLTTFPWEVVPIYNETTYVARVPSLHALFQSINNNRQVPIAVNINKAFYVLDPDNNLSETQRRMTNYVSKFGWCGIVGKIPSASEVTEALKQSDVFFYMGHGSGSRYFSRRAISECKVNAVSVLMGCGSVRLTPLGWGMDGNCCVYDYTIAQCPSLVGCLWTVTDGEIDRYFMALVDLCFSSDANRTLTGAEDGHGRLRLLVEAMKKARSKCKLSYLTGAAVVSYGIPVVALEQ